VDKGSESVTVDNPWTPVDAENKGAAQTVDTHRGHPWTAPTVDKAGGSRYPRQSGGDALFLSGPALPSRRSPERLCVADEGACPRP
jgi:hypothetical protein